MTPAFNNQPSPSPWAVRWLTWPFLLLGSLSAALLSIRYRWDYGSVYGRSVLGCILVLVALELIFPLRSDWKMTWKSFRRDLKYLGSGVVTIAAINALFGMASIRLNAGHRGPITDWPLYLSVPVALLVFEFFQYWQHRLSHEMSGHLGDHMWRVHAPHHLPDRVYVFMHPAAHPLNNLMVRGFVTILPMYLLGASPATVLLVSTLVSVQGLVSHCNVDLRAGWFNYIFVGTELHRYHHSADREESKNYAVALSFMDLLFGTFRYDPDRIPERLGVDDPNSYPDSNEFWRVMRLPFPGKEHAA
jgi:sterol desaturase/sphingolipid hydroxylase (fatty acid hydroxylase superfamily)